MLTNTEEMLDDLFKDSIEKFEEIFGKIDNPTKEEYKVFVVTQMDSTTGQDKIVKIKARTAEEAKDIFIKNQTVFAISLDEWNDTQDMFISDIDDSSEIGIGSRDFKDFLIKSKKEVNEAKVYSEVEDKVKATDLFI